MDALEAQLQPPQSRRVGVALAIGMPLVAVLVFAYAKQAEPEDAECDSAAPRFASVWGDAQRAAVESRFLGSGELHAAKSFGAVQGHLDDYARRWADVHERACRATRVLAEQSEQLLELRMHCLEERRIEVEEFVGALADADAAAVERSASEVERLHGLSLCSDREALLRRASAGAQSSDPARFDAMRHAVAAAEASARVGAADDGLARARAALQEANELESGPHRARAQLALAKLHERRGEYEESFSAATDAWVAADAASADYERLEAAIALTWISGHVKAEYEQSSWFAELGRSVARRLEDPSALEAVLQEKVATVAVDAGRPREAIEILEDLTKAAESPGFTRTRRLDALALAYGEAGDHAQARASFDEALRGRIELLGERHPQVGEVLCHLAGSERATGNVEDAVEHMTRCAELLESAKARTARPLHAVQGELAGMLVDLDRADEAAELYRRALRGWERSAADDVAIGILSARLATLEIDRGHFESAERHARRALTVLEREGQASSPDAERARRALTETRAHIP
jgi:tetratricopeptide (TPR) repeat protein